MDIELSLEFMEALHQRWHTLLILLNHEDFQRTFYHPKSGVLTLETALGLYAWHGKHHIAHIPSLCERMDWRSNDNKEYTT